jgi:glycosyltransferase involved in cell wall biosynthesis
MPTMLRNISWLNEAIDSLLEQDDLNCIILVIDSKSDKKELHSNSIRKSSKVKIYNSIKHGVAANLNLGITLSNAEFIARHDDDDISSPQRLRTQLKILEESDYDFTFSRMRGYKSNPELEQSGEFWPINLLTICHPTHPTVMFKKSSLLRNGTYPEHIIAEDYGKWLQLGQEFKSFYLNTELYTYRNHKFQTHKKWNTDLIYKNLFPIWYSFYRKNFDQDEVDIDLNTLLIFQSIPGKYVEQDWDSAFILLDMMQNMLRNTNLTKTDIMNNEHLIINARLRVKNFKNTITT